MTSLTQVWLYIYRHKIVNILKIILSRVTYYLYSLKILLLFLCKNFLPRFQVSRSFNFRVGVLYSDSTFIQSESCIWCSDWMFFHIHPIRKLYMMFYPIRKLYMMFWLDVFWVWVQNSYSKVLWLWGEVLSKRIDH